jgi:hypothetical protein
MAKDIRADTFERIAIDKFDAMAIARELLTPTIMNDAVREVLLHGFLAWVLRPAESRLRKAAMRVAARRICVDQLEAIALRNVTTPSSKCNAANLESFYSDVINPLGRDRVLFGFSESGFLKDLGKMCHISDVHLILDIWHIWLHSEVLIGKKKLSLCKAVGTFECVGKETKHWKAFSERRLREQADHFAESISFSYSAARITLPSGASLLEDIRKNLVTMEVFNSIKTQWFASAQTVYAEILRKSHNSCLKQTKVNFDLSPALLELPALPQNVIDRIKFHAA